MRPIRFQQDESYTAEKIAEMQSRLAALEQLTASQHHELADQHAEMLRLRTILLAIGRALPDISDFPTIPGLPIVRLAAATATSSSLPGEVVDAAPAPISAPAPTSQPQPAADAPADAPADTPTNAANQTSRRALLKWGGAAAAAGVAATAASAASALNGAPTAHAAGTPWQTGTVNADVPTVVQPASGYSGNDILRLQQGTGSVFQQSQLKTALAAYDTTGNSIGVYGTSSGGTGLYGVTDTGTAAQGRAGLYAQANSSGTGVAGASGSGIAVQGNSNTGIGGSFTGGQAPLALGLGAGGGAPTSGTHVAGEIYADVNAALYVCLQSGTPGTWSKLAIGNAMSFLPAPIRVLDTRTGSGAPQGDGSGPWPGESFHDVWVTGAAVGGVSVPAGARGCFGNVTVTETQGSGYLRLYPAGGINPFTSTINYLFNQTVANAFMVGLSSGGALTVYVNRSATQVILDIAGYVF